MFPYQLVCEGKADEVFFRGLLKTSGKSVDVSCPQREDGGMGIKAIHKRLVGLQAQIDKITVLVVAVDCDDDHQNSFTDAQAEFEKANQENPAKSYEIPTSANTLTNGNPKTGILMVPAMGAKGCLDSLLLPSFEEKFADKLKCTNEFCACLKDARRGYARDARLRLRAIIACTQKKSGHEPRQSSGGRPLSS